MAGNKIRDHLQRHIVELVAERIEDTAPDRFIVSKCLIVQSLAAAGVQVCGEHTHELTDGLADHRAVMPGRRAQRFPAHPLKTAVKPVHDRQVALPYPAVPPDALRERDGTAVFHDVGDHHAIVIEPDFIEVIERVFDASPLSVFVETGTRLVQITETPLPVGLPIEKIAFDLLKIGPLDLLFDFLQVGLFHFASSWIFLISMLSTKAWKRVRSWPDAALTYSFSMEQTGNP